MATTAVILAAGHGTRMKSDLPKVLHPIGGKPMLGHVLDHCRRAGVDRMIVVVGYQKERVQQYLGNAAETVVQEPQLGTGHALLQAQPLLQQARGDVLVLMGDTPFLGPEVLQRLLAVHREAGAAATLLTATVDQPGRLGRIVRDDGGLFQRVVEYKDAGAQEREIREVNSGVGVFGLDDIWWALAQVRNQNAAGEYYLPDVVPILQGRGRTVQAVSLADAADVLAPNDRRDLARAEALWRERVVARWQDAGVTIIDPLSTWIGPDVEIGRDTIVYPGTFLEGNTAIGENCIIGPQARVVDSFVGEGTRIEMSVVEASRVGTGCRIGPFAHLRAGCDLGPDNEIGNYAELKNTRTGIGLKMHHHGYVGDTVIGDRVNIGAGVITSNYDGVAKHVTTIDDDAFVGTNVNLIAPVHIGRSAYVAAGSTVNQNVPADALALARARQVNKEGYASRLRARALARKRNTT